MCAHQVIVCHHQHDIPEQCVRVCVCACGHVRHVYFTGEIWKRKIFTPLWSLASRALGPLASGPPWSSGVVAPRGSSVVL